MSGLLDDLPSTGLLTAPRLTHAGTARVYVPTRPTDAPAGQHVRRDDTHILVRTLDKKKQAAAATGGKSKAGEGGASASEAAAKRAKLAAEIGAKPLTEAAVREFNVQQLKAACSSRGLTVGGTKEALRDRLITHLRAAGAGASSAPAAS